MTVGAGEVVYRQGNVQCSAVGIRWSDNELNAAMDGRVAAVLFDDEGKANIKNILAGVTETDFTQDNLRRLLEGSVEIEDWRVGEAIAECFCTDHRRCSFPWPDGRDERKTRSSLPGADLVGFGVDDDGACFAFGEVKTSSQCNYPPNVMYGPKGMKQQLENLRDDENIRDDLVRYLGHRAGSAPWRAQYKRAARRYILNTSDIQLYGCLVRDVEADRKDLRVLFCNLGANRPEGTCIVLLAIYLPQGSLDGIGGKMISRQAGAER